MAELIQPTEQDLVALLARYGLPAPTAVRPVAGGPRESLLHLEVGGSELLLRISTALSPDDLRYEAELLVHLGARATPVPELLRTEEGASQTGLEAKPAVLFRASRGSVRTAATIARPELQRLGVTLARLHLAASGFPLRRTHGSSPASLRARLESAARAGGPQHGPFLRDELAAGPPARRTRLLGGVIHGELGPNRVGFDEHGDVITLLGFEGAGDGVLVYDLAAAINAWCFVGSFDWDRSRGLLLAYQKIRPLTEPERLALPSELRLSALAGLLERLDVEPEGASTGWDGPGAWRERLEQVRSLQPSQLALRLFG